LRAPKMSMYNQQAVLELIDLTYAAGVEPERWPQMLQSLCSTMDAAGADLAVFNMERPSAQLRAGVGMVDSQFLAEYEKHVWFDPFVITAGQTLVLRPGMVAVGESLVATNVLKRTEFYNDFARHYGYSGGIVGIISGDARGAQSINICRRPAQRMGEAEVRLVRTLIPHVARALVIHEQLVESDTRTRAFDQLLERLTTGALLVEQSGRVVFANGSARSMLAESDGLSVDRGVLRAARARDTNILMNMIGGAAETTVGRSALSGGVLLLGRPSGRRALQLIVSPLSARTDAFPEKRLGAIVFINDPERVPEADTTVLRRAHGLSRAEAEVARLLLQDRTVQEIGEALSISTNTVRFHLKQLFSKSGTRRQSELVRLLLATTQVTRE
jgi:DNA-binding CsgD family transcriptional regulator